MKTVSHKLTGHSPLHPLRVVAGLSLVAIAGCAAQGVGQGGTGVVSGVWPLMVDDHKIYVSIQPGAAGTAITSKGTRAVTGQTLRVTGADIALTMDQGALAKKSARAACSASGGRLNEGALGAFDRATGAWVFAGGCA